MLSASFIIHRLGISLREIAISPRRRGTAPVFIFSSNVLQRSSFRRGPIRSRNGHMLVARDPGPRTSLLSPDKSKGDYFSASNTYIGCLTELESQWLSNIKFRHSERSLQHVLCICKHKIFIHVYTLRVSLHINHVFNPKLYFILITPCVTRCVL